MLAYPDSTIRFSQTLQLTNNAALLKEDEYKRRVRVKWLSPQKENRKSKGEEIKRKKRASNYVCYVEMSFYYLDASIPQ